MSQLTAEVEKFRSRNLEFLALNVDGLQSPETSDRHKITATLDRIGWPYSSGIAGVELLKSFVFCFETRRTEVANFLSL